MLNPPHWLYTIACLADERRQHPPGEPTLDSIFCDDMIYYVFITPIDSPPTPITSRRSMNPHRTVLRPSSGILSSNATLPRWLVACLGTLCCSWTWGQGVATDRELAPVQVQDRQETLNPLLPSSSFSITAQDLEDRPTTNVQDALNYAPSAQLRKLRPGDPNGGLGGRSFGVGQPQRALVYVDGMLISNFLASHQVARWSMVNEEELERMDVLYGPFSAIYPGNSIGTTVAFTTRMPRKPEAHLRAQIQTQTQDDYGQGLSYRGHQQSAYIGSRWSDLSAAVTINRFEGTTHGTSYTTTPLRTTQQGGIPVTGQVNDKDIYGNPRLILGSTGESDAVQTLFKTKLAYDFLPTLAADFQWAQYSAQAKGSARTYLRDALGTPVWSGNVLIQGATYTLPWMGPRSSDEEHHQLGLRLRTRNTTGWNASLQWSRYEVRKDETLSSSRAMDASAGVVPGTSGSSVGAGGGGTGWRTLELQATYTPSTNEAHTITLGYHQNRYALASRSFNLTDWHDTSTRTTETANYFGNTRVQALYLQDTWAIAPDWSLTAGWRHERFQAEHGSQMFHQAQQGQPIIYPERVMHANSPKLSLGKVLNDEWLGKVSLGRGTRFPTVAELYQGSLSGTEIVQNDPRLQPESSQAMELSLMREQDNASTRISLFQDTVRNAIFSQRSVTASGAVTTVRRNIDKTRVRGIELVWQGRNVAWQGLDLQASATFSHARILANQVTPASLGKTLPGIPRIRLSTMATWRQGPWSTSLGLRHQSRTFNTLDNSDIHPATFGGSNAITVADLKVSYRFGPAGSLAMGINNLNNYRYYQTHPYAGRALFLELNLKY